MNQEVNYYKYTSSGLASLASSKIRRKIFDLFMETMEPTDNSLILDVGVTPNNERPESNFFENLYPYKNRITAVSIEDASNLEKLYPGLRFVMIKDGRLPFNDNEFDVAFSNAVLEHVGSRAQQRRFIAEMIRVSRKCFIAVPDRIFPIEHHTALPLIHYFPQELHRRLLRILGKELYASEERLNLLTKGIFKSLFPSNVKLKIMRTRLLLIPSNIIAVVTKEGF